MPYPHYSLWNFSLCYFIHISSGVHLASCPMGIGGFFPRGKSCQIMKLTTSDVAVVMETWQKY
jgi:hypothetical protein